jgi:hypothetical protein
MCCVVLCCVVLCCVVLCCVVLFLEILRRTLVVCRVVRFQDQHHLRVLNFRGTNRSVRIHVSNELLYQWHVGEWAHVLADTAFVLKLISPSVNELVLWYMLTCTRVIAVFFAKWITQNVFSQADTIFTTRAPPTAHNLFSAGI